MIRQRTGKTFSRLCFAKPCQCESHYLPGVVTPVISKAVALDVPFNASLYQTFKWFYHLRQDNVYSTMQYTLTCVYI